MAERVIGSGTTMAPRDQRANAVPRVLNLILGIWLFISAFVWPHNYAQFTNTWVCGVVVALLALIAFGASQARFLNTLLAVWLFISAFVLGHVDVATVWNNALVAVAVFLISLAPSTSTPMRTQTPHPA